MTLAASPQPRTDDPVARAERQVAAELKAKHEREQAEAEARAAAEAASKHGALVPFEHVHVVIVVVHCTQ